MGGQLGTQVVATGRHIRDDTGQGESMCLYPGTLSWGKISLNLNGLKSSPAGLLSNERSHLLGILRQQFRKNPVGTFRSLDLTWNHEGAIGRASSGENPALPIHDFSTRSFQSERANGVPLGSIREVRTLQDLELKETEDEQAESRENERGNQSYAKMTRGFVGTLKPRFIGLHPDHMLLLLASIWSALSS
jgi:hypothetical protein